ncbi:hypothetical protein [Granulicella sibirica]|uniref:hypothetical protein n=1 Tax=Granulicella sibirica TaxID=2479048 RepID=UPI0010089D42|nr:hypothetical protein [Granulicella sibirica]
MVLMNRILAERLDLSEVNGKLDQLHEDIGGLNAALHPMANLPQPVLALLNQGDVLATQCTNMMSDWARLSIDASHAAMQARTAERRAALEGRVSSSSSATLDEEKAKEFARIYSPRLAAFNATLHRFVPDAAPIADISIPASAQQAANYAFDIQMLSKRYQENQAQSGRPYNSQLVNQITNAFADANRFCRDWNQAKMDSLTSGRQADRLPTHSTNPADPTSSVNADEAEKYSQTLRPKLISFRDAVLPQVPAYSSGRDYDAVSTSSQLGGICSDVRTLSAAFQQKALQEAEHKRVPGK